MDSPTPIVITTGTLIRVIVIGALAYAAWSLRDLLLLVLTAIVIASAIEPGVGWLAKRRIPRILSVFVVYSAVLGSVFAALYAFLPRVLADAQALVAALPAYVEQLNIPASTVPGGGVLVTDGTQSLLGTLVSLSSAFTGSTEAALALAAAVFGGMLAFMLVMVLAFYFAVQETDIESFLRVITPARREEYVVGLWLRARRKIGLWMQGQMLSALVCGAITYAGLLLIGLPYALLLGVASGVGTLVPIFGLLLTGIPAIAVGLATGGTPLALAVVALYLFVNQIEAHVVNPLIVNKIVGIPPLLVIIALVAGAELAGFIGVIIAIPVAAALRELLVDYDKGKRAAAQLVS